MRGIYQEVAADIFQVRLPLPFALDHVNCYLLRGDAGWTILDTGLNISAARELWQAVFVGLGIAPADIERIVLTHTHPDHYGLAGWLQQLCRAEGEAPPVYMSSREAELARQVWGDIAAQVERMAAYFAWCGLPGDMAQTIASETNKVGSRMLPHPEYVALLASETTLQIGERHFTVMHAPGHSDGQLIFYDPNDQLLLCGDHVLIKITPHIGFWPDAEPDPLGRYLTSLRELAALEVRLALPGHRASIVDWPGRLTELQTHHHDRLKHTLEAVNMGNTVYEVSKRVFRLDGLNAHEARFAVAETLSHLEYLVRRGCLRREDDMVWRYSQV